MFYEIEIQDVEPLVDDFQYSSVIRFTPADYSSACHTLMHSLLFNHNKEVTVKVTVKF